MKLRSLITTASLSLLLFSHSAFADRVADTSSGKSPDAADLVLFPFDDVSIPWRSNLKLVLQRPTKYPGNPVMEAGPIEGPDGYGPKLYGTVIRQGGKLRMWYDACPRPDSRIPGDVAIMSDYSPVAYAESTDGKHWMRPDLGLVEFRGSRHNNLVLIEPTDEPYARTQCTIAVYYDASDPDPNRCYKMAYITKDKLWRESSTATAVSPDGLRWRLVNTVSFTKGLFENMSLTKFHDLYYLAGQNHPPFDAEDADGSPVGRVMKVFFSPDFRHWSDGRALGFYRNDYKPTPMHFGEETHMGASLWNRGNVILGLYGRWHGSTLVAKPSRGDRSFYGTDYLEQNGVRVGLTGLTLDLGLVISNDAIHYREPVRNFVMVPYGGSTDWDSDAILQANAFANTSTETYIWYSRSAMPNETIGPIPPLPAPLPSSFKPEAIGLLTLPRDRFGFFSKLLAVSHERNPVFNLKRDASCLTTSLHLSVPSRLYANVDDVSPAAPLQIALVDDAERPLEGYTAKLASPALKGPVAWSGGQRVLPFNRPFRIKVTWPIGVDQAKLYALYLEHE